MAQRLAGESELLVPLDQSIKSCLLTRANSDGLHALLRMMTLLGVFLMRPSHLGTCRFSFIRAEFSCEV